MLKTWLTQSLLAQKDRQCYTIAKKLLIMSGPSLIHFFGSMTDDDDSVNICTVHFVGVIKEPAWKWSPWPDLARLQGQQLRSHNHPPHEDESDNDDYVILQSDKFFSDDGDMCYDDEDYMD